MGILIFIVILSVLVLIHELGHFVMARVFKMRVEEFGIGLPPRARKLFTKGGTIFSLNWLPIGGFVKLWGEDMEDESQASSPEAFFNKPIWQRAGVLVAGVVMNFVLGVILFAVVYSFVGIPVKTNLVIVDGVASGSPAEKVEIKSEDVFEVLEVDGVAVSFKDVSGFIDIVSKNKGKEIVLTVNRGGEKLKKSLIPRENPPQGEGALGVTLTSVKIVNYPWYEKPFRGIMAGLDEALSWGREITLGLKNLVVDVFSGKGAPKDVAGPVGIYQATKNVYGSGILPILMFMGVLSINLAIMNIMPFPALDGGRIAFLFLEIIIGKKLKNKIEGYVHTGGMVFLLGLMVLITIRDILRLFGKV